jgi:hypothetical protein
VWLTLTFVISPVGANVPAAGSYISDTQPFRDSVPSTDVITLPTGDGMAIVFFRDPVAPAQTALEIARAAKLGPELSLRMGIHQGPVYRRIDIQDQLNVTGGAINVAQRVMDCGESGHILLSKAVADVLLNFAGWNDSLHDLGEWQVKHGMSVHLYNLFTREAGNASWPTKRLTATRSGDLRALTQLLARDVRVVTDGGGKVAAALNVLDGGDRAARFLIGVAHKGWRDDFALRFATINGLPGVILDTPQGPVQTTAFEIESGVIRALYVVRNPEKLRHLAAASALQEGDLV